MHKAHLLHLICLSYSSAKKTLKWLWSCSMDRKGLQKLFSSASI